MTASLGCLVAIFVMFATRATASIVNVEVCDQGQMAVGYTTSSPGYGAMPEYTGMILTHDCGMISKTTSAGLDALDQMCEGTYKYNAGMQCSPNKSLISAVDTGKDKWDCQPKQGECSSTIVVTACCSRSS